MDFFAFPVARPYLSVLFILCMGNVVFADDERVRVNPYRMDVITDGRGKKWDIREDGSVVNGSSDCFDGALDLIIEGSRLRYLYQRKINESRENLALWFRVGNQYQIGPLELDSLPGFKGVTVTRHIGLTTDKKFLRYIDVFHNKTALDKKIRFQARLDFGSSLVKVREMAKKNTAKSGPWALSYQQRVGRPSVVHIVRGPNNNKLPNSLTYRSDVAIESYGPFTVKAGEKVAIAHFVAQLKSPDESAKAIASFKISQALKGVPGELKSCLLNFSGGLSIEGFSLAREEEHDVVVLRSGKMLVGTVIEKEFSIKGLVGDHVFGRDVLIGIKIMGEGQGATARVGCLDQQIFAGELGQKRIAFRLRNGPLLSIKVSMIESLGFRTKGEETRAGSLTPPKSFIHLRTGDVLGIEGFQKGLILHTRYGRLTLKLGQLRLLNLEDPGNWGHGVTLRRGSRFGCLLENAEFKVFLTEDKVGTGQAAVSIPREMVLQVLGATVKQSPAPAGTFALKMRNGDRLASQLSTESLTLRSDFGVIKFSTRDIRSMVFAEGGLVKFALWGGNLLRGKLVERELTLRLAETKVKVPVALILSAEQNQMMLPGDIVAGLRGLVKNLDSDDLEEREDAERRLKGLGPVIRSLLKSELIKEGSSPEMRLRIRAVLKALPKLGKVSRVDLGELRKKLKANKSKKNRSKMGVPGVLKIIANAQKVYRDEDRDKNGVTDYGDLSALVKHIGKDGGLSDELASGKILGYIVKTGPSSHERGVESRWWASAEPESGKGPWFFINQSGIVYVSESGFELDRQSCDVPFGLKKWVP